MSVAQSICFLVLRSALFLGIALAFSACDGYRDDNPSTHDDTRPWDFAPNDTDTRTDEDLSEAQGVFSLTNEYRAANGLSPLIWNSQLASAAQDFAERMANEGFFDHTSPDGVTVGERITSAGYDWRTYGENIAYGYSTPEATMQGWINSSGHRANILGQGYKDLGVGYARSKSGTGYWVQDFGAQ
ncbi:MAG: hypothetical protein A2X94_10205 [Bdellovibrionales bacterium GWB1_55_8]|nr:MAG: hypothetical protein A2X94_10205 [Bdellovibrionales bacterium GWB1_55_8]